MRRYLCTFALAGLLMGVTLAQQPPPGSTPPVLPQDQTQSTPPTFPRDDQQQAVPPTRPEIQSPVETPSPASSSADLQARIQDAVRQQLPSSADQVKVNVADDGSVQLMGTVLTDRERQQVEDVARSAAPNHTITNKLKVGGAVPGTSRRDSALPQSDQEQRVAKPKSGQNITPPNRGDEDWPQTGSSTTQQSPTNPEGAMTPTAPSAQGSSSEQTRAQTSSQSSAASQNPSSSQSGQTPALPQSDQAINNVQGMIQSALQQDPALANANVSANVTGTKVELTGTAPDQHARKAAEDIARTNGAGRRVVNHIKVKSGGSPY